MAGDLPVTDVLSPTATSTEPAPALSPILAFHYPSHGQDYELFDNHNAGIPVLGGQDPLHLVGDIKTCFAKRKASTSVDLPSQHTVGSTSKGLDDIVISIPGDNMTTVDSSFGYLAEILREEEESEVNEFQLVSQNVGGGDEQKDNGIDPARTVIRKTSFKKINPTSTKGDGQKINRAKRQRVHENGVVVDGEGASPIHVRGENDNEQAQEEEEEDEGGGGQDESCPERRQAQGIRRTKIQAEQMPKVASGPGKRNRRRAESPGDGEDRKIQEDIVKMKDLCTDIRIGKKSNRFKELESIDWKDLSQRQREQRELEIQRVDGELDDETMEQRLERLAEASGGLRTMAAPQMRIVNGEIVLDEESLRVDRHQRDALEETQMEVVEENQHTRLVNSRTWSKRDKGDRWEADATQRFYDALSMFGTDFELISKLFPGRSRRQIKNKFNCEERKHPDRITQSLKNRVVVDLSEYSELAGQEFPEPHELEEELQKLRDEHETEGELHKAQAVEMERERQEHANQAMRDTENGTIHEQSGKRKKKGKGKDMSKSGEVVLPMTIEEYERERLRRQEEEE